MLNVVYRLATTQLDVRFIMRGDLLPKVENLQHLIPAEISQVVNKQEESHVNNQCYDQRQAQNEIEELAEEFERPTALRAPLVTAPVALAAFTVAGLAVLVTAVAFLVSDFGHCGAVVSFQGHNGRFLGFE